MPKQTPVVGRLQASDLEHQRSPSIGQRHQVPYPARVRLQSLDLSLCFDHKRDLQCCQVPYLTRVQLRHFCLARLRVPSSDGEVLP